MKIFNNITIKRRVKLLLENLRILLVSQPWFEHLIKCATPKCAVSPELIIKHIISSVFSLAQILSPSMALPAELVWGFNHTDLKIESKQNYYLRMSKLMCSNIQNI